MLDKLMHQVTGYACFEVTGDIGRFFNIAAKSRIPMWGFARRGKQAVAWVRCGDYRKLRDIRRRTASQVHCIKKGGLPFVWNRLWKRKGLLVGSLLGMALYVFLSGFLWGVEVEGTGLLTPHEVLQAAAGCGLYEGVKIQEISPNLAAQKLLLAVPELSWATVNTDGNYLKIVVKEKESKPEITQDARFSNIYAQREGKVVAIEGQRGKVEVKLGDVVERGQLLISGLYSQELDPYSPPPPHPFVIMGCARGSVTAETYREFKVEIPLEEQVMEKNGKVQAVCFLEVFGVKLPLGLYVHPQEPYQVFTRRNRGAALGVSLPLSLLEETRSFTEEVQVTLTKEQAQERALLALREQQREALPVGASIYEEALSYTFTGNSCILTSACWSREEIGFNQVVLDGQ